MEDVVISGASCRLPLSDSVEEFMENLYGGVDMVTEGNPHWEPESYDLPSRSGTLKSVEKFDAAFFSVPPKQAALMDPQQRMLLEVSYEALVDSGTNPMEITGSKTGVFIGSCQNEALEMFTADLHQIAGYEMTGCSRNMLANRVSYHFDFNGPSYCLDAACASGMLAFSHALHAIRNGQCDSALVGGVNLLLRPTYSKLFSELKMLASDGKCKSFDAKADGYVRSEGLVVFYLQKVSCARRVYTHIIHALDNCDGYTEQGLTFPSGEKQKELIHQVYSEAEFNPDTLTYLEAHGTGTRAGDSQEVATIAEVYCKKRQDKLLVGSVKSNVGHTEATSGLVGILKVLLAYKKHMIAGNLHVHNMNPDIPQLQQDKLQIVTKNTPWKCGPVGVNTFGIGGTNVHVLLFPPHETHVIQAPPDGALLTITSGRTKAACDRLIQLLGDNPDDMYLQSLVVNASMDNKTSHPVRAFTVTGNETTVIESKGCNHQDNPPLWYVFGGMGSQWSGMGCDMMQHCEVFRQSITRLDTALQHVHFSVSDLLLQADHMTFTSPLNTTVGIIAIQVALVDTLEWYGLTPDGMIGHSLGELGCAYADGTLTGNQVIQTAYWRGRAVYEAKLPPGAMAATGLTWEEAMRRCPSGVIPACHNAPDIVTVSGPEKSVMDMVEQLHADNVFARLIDTSKIAFHSPMLKPCAPRLKQILEKIIPVPKKRSNKWISSSVPEASWDTESAEYSSASYHVNNFLNPVLFSKAVSHIPTGALVLEIGPHGIMNSILKRQTTNIHILQSQKKNLTNNHAFFLTSLGRGYLNGINLNKDMLKFPLQYPVPVSTPMLASHILWNHDEQWVIPKYSPYSTKGHIQEVSLDASNSFHYIRDHVIDGKVFFPAAGYAYLAWTAFAELTSNRIEKTRVSIKKLKIERATVLSENDKVLFKVDIHPHSRAFEITERDGIVAKGEIGLFVEERTITPGWVQHPQSGQSEDDMSIILDSNDFYKDMRIRGLEYGATFRSVNYINYKANRGSYLWDSKWIPFLDAFMQTFTFSKHDRSLRLPIEVAQIDICPDIHHQMFHDTTKGKLCDFHWDMKNDIMTAGGVTIHGIRTTTIPRVPKPEPCLHQILFTPYIQTNQHIHNDTLDTIDLHQLSALLDIAEENSFSLQPEICIIEQHLVGSKFSLKPAVDFLISKSPMVRYKTDNCSIYSSHSSEEQTNSIECISVKKQNRFHIVLVNSFADWFGSRYHIHAIKNMSNILKSQGFLLLVENVRDSKRKSIDSNLINTEDGVQVDKEQNSIINEFVKAQFDLIAIAEVNSGQRQILFRKQSDKPRGYTVVHVSSENWSWVDHLKSKLKDAEDINKNIWLISKEGLYNGLVKCVRALTTEPDGHRIRCLVNCDEGTLPTDTSPGNPGFEEIVTKDLVMNVYKNGKWGSFRHYHMSNDRQKHAVPDVRLDAPPHSDLRSLRWAALHPPTTRHNTESQKEVKVCYSALNFRDLMLASGRITPESVSNGLIDNVGELLGLEFSGMDSQGNHVMGISGGGALCSRIWVDPDYLWVVPASWTLQEAASVLVAYTTAYYSLVVRAAVKRYESVLIHSAASSLGQAAIRVAQSVGCQIYVTVGTQEKADYLNKQYHIKKENIFFSRNTEFTRHITNYTDNKGVNVILNTLTGDLLMASVHLLAEGGRFIELGKYDMQQNTDLGMCVFLKNTSFHGVLAEHFLRPGSREWPEVRRLVDEGIQNGVIKPLQSLVYNMKDHEGAFHRMADGTHIGKILIKMYEGEENATNYPLLYKENTVLPIEAITSTHFDPKGVIIITGGLGGLGLEMADWMVTRGVRHLILTSRSGVKTGYQKYMMQRMKNQGCNVLVSLLDVADLQQTKELFKYAGNFGPVTGVFHLAAVLDDGILPNQTIERFLRVVKPKVSGVLHLDQVSRALHGNSFKHFVVFSTAYAQNGQSNYAYANSFMERVCEKRKEDGLPATAIQWGFISDVGIIQQIGENNTNLYETEFQKIHSFLDTLDLFLHSDITVVSSWVQAESEHISGHHSHIEGNKEQRMLKKTLAVLGITSVDDVSPDTPLREFGLDSLMTTEIGQILDRHYSIRLTATEIQTLTVYKLKQLAANANKR